MTTMKSDFDDRVVAITGAASGMGAACAQVFADRGATVAVIDKNQAGAETTADALASASLWVGDVTSTEFVEAAIEGVVAQHGQIDVLVNAAGIIHRADVLGTSDDDWDRVMGVNAKALFKMSRAALPYMIERQSGSIVNFGSISGTVAAPGGTVYCASKGAVHQLTLAMALDHVGDGIRVNAVAPGEVNTPMLASGRSTPPTQADLQALADASIPMKRLADPIEIARVVAFLASDDASYMTGEIVHVDAGYRAQ